MQCICLIEQMLIDSCLGGFIYLVAPKIIVFDNCCNLHSYCLNRDPNFFRNTLFVVDRFHWFNHTGKVGLLTLFILHSQLIHPLGYVCVSDFMKSINDRLQ